jgi:hypothetical protein
MSHLVLPIKEEDQDLHSVLPIVKQSIDSGSKVLGFLLTLSLNGLAFSFTAFLGLWYLLISNPKTH